MRRLIKHKLIIRWNNKVFSRVPSQQDLKKDVFKTSYKTKNDTLKTFSRRRLHQNECLLDGSSQLSETSGIRKNILLRGSNMVLLRYLRQMKYGKTYYLGEVISFQISVTNEIWKGIFLRWSNTDLFRYLRQIKYRKTHY